VIRVNEAITVIKPKAGWTAMDLKSLWLSREFFYFLVWRDLKVRYKQTAIGIVWSILKPLGTMVIFTVIMSVFARMPSDGLPYPVFFYSAILSWNYFSEAITSGSQSLVSNASLVTKVHFPKLIIPIACLFPPLADFFLSFAVLLGLMAWFRIMPTLAVLVLPFFVLFTLITALAVSIWLSALNVRYRDVGHAISFFVQIWFFASPIMYPASVIPQKLRALYALNPMFSVIEGFRWALLGKPRPDLLPMAISVVIVLVLLVAGLIYFKRVEHTFADVI
jgi:lipopolysaccharide transport system permease protein